MSEVKRYEINGTFNVPEIGQKLENPKMVMEADFDRITAERDALQQRLTAADERADVLETALKKISARCVAYIEAEREMPESSVEVCQMIASAALKPAEAGADSCGFCKGWGFRANPDGADEGCGACNGTGKEPVEGGGDA